MFFKKITPKATKALEQSAPSYPTTSNASAPYGPLVSRLHSLPVQEQLLQPRMSAKDQTKWNIIDKFRSDQIIKSNKYRWCVYRYVYMSSLDISTQSRLINHVTWWLIIQNLFVEHLAAPPAKRSRALGVDGAGQTPWRQVRRLLCAFSDQISAGCFD